MEGGLDGRRDRWKEGKMKGGLDGRRDRWKEG